MSETPEAFVKSTIREERRMGVILLVIALVLAITLGFAYRTDQKNVEQDRVNAERDQEVVQLKDAVAANGKAALDAKRAAEEANRHLKAAGKPTVPVPTVTPIIPSGTEVTEELVRAWVAEEVAKEQLTTAEVAQIARAAAALIPKPKDGQTPTASQVQGVISSTVLAYCANGRCKGEDAPTITPRPGKDGDDGADAPKVTDEQLLAAARAVHAAYCSQESKPCDAVDGKPGAKGDPGRGVRDLDCIGIGADSFWRITYTDDTVTDESGPCRLPLEAPPTTAAKKGK